MPSERNSNGIPQPIVLVVDDDAGQRSLLSSFLKTQSFEVVTAASGELALEAFQSQRVDMMISDVRMTGISGLETLRRVRAIRPLLPVLMVTAFPDIRGAVDAMRDGAVNYLEKPIDLDELLTTVRQALGLSCAPRAAVAEEIKLPENVIAFSPQMRNVIREVSFVAPSETRVLITGESGVGKEVVADLIHALSPRTRGPLVKVNCAAIPETLLESELFGHEKGSFTGATHQRVGRFEEANGGTILLDEIGEMSPALQAKLLRITQDGSFQRVGGNGVRRTDARLIAATNRNLEKEVLEGRFREDLFFRLNVVEIFVPPLRERREDILPLANLFSAEFSKGRPRLSAATVTCLELYDWPGNIRELRNAMERAILMARGELILPEHLPRRVQSQEFQSPGAAEKTGNSPRMEEVERAVILQTLRANNYNRSETARALGLSRRTLLYKIQRFREQGFAVEQD